MLSKLENLGIRGVVNAWFKSYLSERKQYMEFHNITSPLEDIISGVPQGSILGPILFLVCVNDISNSTSLNILSFADDTTASFSSICYGIKHDVTQLYNKTNDELKKLNDWFCANTLSLNAKKTKYIHFRPNITHPNTNNRHIILNEHHVDRVGNTQNEKSFNFLGIHMDKHFWIYTYP